MSRDYPARPLVGVGVAVLRPGPDGAEVLLIRRGHPPNEGAWSLPGGGQELGETTEACARRELAEETGLEVADLHLAAVVDSITPDHDDRIRFHYTIIDYAALWDSGTAIAGGDATDIVWAPIDRLDDYTQWREAHRVIARARDILGC